MSKTVRFALGLAAAATMITAFAAASASARNFSSTAETLRATWREMIFTDPFGGRVVCPVTLEGTFHRRTIPKTPYTLIGNITEAIVGTRAHCTNGEATILRETLPWNVRYQSFVGRLPNITRINTLIANASFRVFDAGLGATCLFTTRDTVREHARGIFSRETVTGALTEVEVGGSITSNEACPLRIAGTLEGRSITLTRLNETGRITITLI